MSILDKLGLGEHECTKNKYKIYLLAYKNLDEKDTNRLVKHFISFINKPEDICKTTYMGLKGSSGLDFRISIYQKVFEEKILETLKEGYLLGIVEMQLEYVDTQGKILKALSDELGENIEIVGEIEL